MQDLGRSSKSLKIKTDTEQKSQRAAKHSHRCVKAQCTGGFSVELIAYKVDPKKYVNLLRAVRDEVKLHQQETELEFLESFKS